MSDGARRWAFIFLGTLIVNLVAGVARPDWPTVAIAEFILVLGGVWTIGVAARLAWGPAHE